MPNDSLPQVLSVCMTLPTAVRPHQGIFVYRRLEAMSRHLPLRALRPQPWFPGLRGGEIDRAIGDASFPIDCRRMFYLPGLVKSLDGRWMERCIKRWLDEQNPPPSTILDAHFGFPEGVACHRVARERGLPFFVTLRGVEEEWLQRRRIRDQIVRALNEASGVIAVSESLRAAAVAVGVDPARIRVIPNGCDAKTFHAGCKSEARQQLGWNENKKRLVSVANIKRVKGHDLLIAALRQLKTSVDFELVCIGDEEQPDFMRQIRELISRFGLDGNVRFTGPLEPREIAQYLRAADVFVLASRREGCCNAIREAMACGTPVVATAVGDNPELARRFDGVQLVGPEDPDSLAAAIRVTVQRRDLPGSSASRRFQPRSWDEIAADCVALMREAVPACFGALGPQQDPAAGAACGSQPRQASRQTFR